MFFGVLGHPISGSTQVYTHQKGVRGGEGVKITPQHSLGWGGGVPRILVGGVGKGMKRSGAGAFRRRRLKVSITLLTTLTRYDVVGVRLRPIRLEAQFVSLFASGIEPLHEG